MPKKTKITNNQLQRCIVRNIKSTKPYIKVKVLDLKREDTKVKASIFIDNKNYSYTLNKNYNLVELLKN